MLYLVCLIEVWVQNQDSRKQKYEDKSEREQMRLGYLYENSQLPTILCVLSAGSFLIPTETHLCVKLRPQRARLPLCSAESGRLNNSLGMQPGALPFPLTELSFGP